MPKAKKLTTDESSALRDQLAGQAMIGLLANNELVEANKNNLANMVTVAYNCADIMLEERSRVKKDEKND